MYLTLAFIDQGIVCEILEVLLQLYNIWAVELSGAVLVVPITGGMWRTGEGAEEIYHDAGVH